MIQYGYCLICEKEIAQRCGHCDTRKPGSQYTEVTIEWTNKAKMNVAVCVDCAARNAHATPEGKAAITKAHHDHWTELGGQFDKEVVVV